MTPVSGSLRDPMCPFTVVIRLRPISDFLLQIIVLRDYSGPTRPRSPRGLAHRPLFVLGVDVDRSLGELGHIFVAAVNFLGRLAKLLLRVFQLQRSGV